MQDEARNEFFRGGMIGRCDRRTFLKGGAMLAGTVALGLPLAACAPQAPKQIFETKGAIPAGGLLSASAQIVSEKKGFFRDEGIGVEWTEFAGGGDNIRAVTTGGMPLGIGSYGAAAAAFEQGQPIRIVADGWHDTDNCWVVRADSPLQSVKDIKGKKVSYSAVGSNTHMLLLSSLRGAGINPDEVQLLASGATPDTWTAVKTGVIDVGFCLQPLVSQIVLAKEARVLWWARDYLKEWSNTPLVCNADFAKQNPDVVKAYVRGYMKGLDFIKNNRVDAAKVYAEAAGLQVDIATEAYKATPDKAFNVKVSKTFLDFLDDLYVEFKITKQKPDWKTLFDQSYLPDSLKSTL
ncbi:MAG: ABC transporter substrate-binding protein [Dehalococcoidia bacterium]|nr:ABC transporter substrate-binding protein [Dehalococcoidia bacterium]